MIDVENYLRQYQSDGPLPRLFQTTRIYDRNGILIAEVYGEGRREWLSLKQMSPFLVEATVTTEDVTFYTNLGIDPIRVAGAALDNLTAGKVVSGASTITMQLARNLFMGPDERYEQSMDRKQQEAKLAAELTRRYSKEELLEMYMNLLNYGNLAYGPEAAAQTYFAKSAADLTQAEATFLAGLPQTPFDLDPFTNFPAAKRRHRIVLDVMVRQLKLTEQEANALYKVPLNLVQEAPQPLNRAPHFVQFVEMQMDGALGTGYMRRSGLNIYTTLDLRMQEVAQDVVNEAIAQLGPRYGMSNASLVAMRPNSGEVLTMIGSRDFYDEGIDGQVNVALSLRQPGSSIKPILYAIALDDLLISPATVLWDTPITYSVGGPIRYRPENYDRKFHGLVTVRTALANSYNVPAVKLISALGVDRMLEGARAMGIKSLYRSAQEYGLSLALGSGEVTLLDHTVAFHTLASEGRYFPPQSVLGLADRLGGAVSQPEQIAFMQPVAPRQAISAATAFLVTDILSDNQARAPVFGTNSRLQLTYPAAAKTGTTNEWRDNWTMGYTRYLVTGVWVGNSDGTPMRGSTGASGAAPIWHDFMERVMAEPALLAALGAPTAPTHTAPANWEFIPPSDVVQLAPCPLGLTCRDGGEYFSRAWLDATNDAPLADTVVTAPMLPVHADRAGNPWLSIFCGQAGGDVRTLLNLQNLLGHEFAPAAVDREALVQDSLDERRSTVELGGVFQRITYFESGRAELLFYPHAEIERFETIAWSRGRGMPVYVGSCDKLNFYEVQNGDYWSQLAQDYGVSVAALQAANPQALRSSGYLLPGDRLLVPSGITLQVTDNSTHYMVKEGDTWSAISQEFGISMGLLMAANPDIVRPGYMLKPDDNVLIPTTGL